MNPASVWLAAAWLLTYAIHSTVLLGTVWLLARRSLLSPGLADTLWKVALVGGVVTATWHVAGIGVEPLGGRVLLSPPTDTAAAAPDVFPWDGAVLADAAPAVTGNAGAWDGIRHVAGRLWPYAVLGLWLAGAMVGLGRLLAVRVRLTRGLHARRELADGSVRRLLDGLCRRSGVNHRIRLTASHRIGGPMALGRSEICLPERALSDLGADRQESVLAHELAHLVRRDPTWRWVSTIVERLFFFQPLNRMAKEGLRESAEFLCDDWAVKRTGERVTLAKCLVEVAGWLEGPARPLHAPAMAERGSSLVHRVERILTRGGKPEISGRRRAALAVGLLVAVSAASPAVTTVTPDLSEPVEQAAIAPEPLFVPAAVEVHTVSIAPLPSPPSLIVVPEPERKDVFVFAVEPSTEPVRVELERLVVELERLHTEMNRLQHRRVRVRTEHREALRRLFEVKKQLEQTGTLHLEVLAPTRIEQLHERMRIETIKGVTRAQGRRILERNRELYRPSWI